MSALSSGTLLAGKYRIAQQLGRGGMGEVYLAENIDIGRKVAIKLLLPEAARDPQTVKRFRQEARAAAAIGHPGIVEVLDLGRTNDGAEFIVMEHLRGETLGGRLRRQPRLPVKLALSIATGILDALEAAHAHKVVHRDLKPENVFLLSEPGFAVKLLDFGVSKLLGLNEQSLKTESGMVLGTPLYMPPEQAMGKKDLGPPADLYSLGVILHQMLSGQLLFQADNYVTLLLMVVQEKPRALAELRPGLPAGLSELVAQLLEKEPARRPDAAQLRERLKAIGPIADEPADESAFAATLPPTPSDELAVTEVPVSNADAMAATEAPLPSRPADVALELPSPPAPTAHETVPPSVRRLKLWHVGAILLIGMIFLPNVRRFGGRSRPATTPAPDVARPRAPDAAPAVSSRPVPDRGLVAADLPQVVAKKPIRKTHPKKKAKAEKKEGSEPATLDDYVSKKRSLRKKVPETEPQ